MSLLRPMLDHSLHWITLSIPEVKVLIGILPHERVEPQNIKIELALGFPDLYPSGKSGHLNQSLDYRAIKTLVTSILSATRFGLLESAQFTLAQALLMPPFRSKSSVQAQTLCLGIEKLNIFNDAIPGIWMTHSAARIAPKIPIESSSYHMLYQGDFISGEQAVGILQSTEKTSWKSITQMKGIIIPISGTWSHQLGAEHVQILHPREITLELSNRVIGSGGRAIWVGPPLNTDQ